jgi:hypothetical protein
MDFWNSGGLIRLVEILQLREVLNMLVVFYYRSGLAPHV